MKAIIAASGILEATLSRKPLLAVLPALLCLQVLSFGAPPPVPGLTRMENNVFLMENHSTAYLVWHALDMTNRTLIHVDAHDDFRYISPEKLRSLQELTANRQYQAIFRLSDLGSSLAFEVRPDKFLYDIGNYIYPCIVDGTISRVWWIVPDRQLDTATQTRLQTHLQAVLRLPLETVFTAETNRFSFSVSNVAVTVSTLEAMPSMPEGTLLDIDTDFFVFSNALSETHMRGNLSWDPAQACSLLGAKAPNPKVVTICSSVWGGYLPLMYRFLSDAMFDHASTGIFPPYAQELLSSAASMWAGPTKAIVPRAPEDSVFQPAYHQLMALYCLTQGNREEAEEHVLAAATNSPVYARGILDLAITMMYMGRFDDALRLVDKFRDFAGKVTVPELSTKALIHLQRGSPKEADEIAGKLVQWDDQESFKLLHAGALTQQGKTNEAMSIYMEILRSGTPHAVPFYDMGVLFEKQGQIDQAIECYQRALAVAPSFDRAHEHLGYLLLSKKNDIIGAISALTKAVEANPFSTSSLSNLGLALSRQDRLEEALACLQAAVRLNPDVAETQANLGLILSLMKRNDEAMIHYVRALELKPEWPEVEAATNQLPESSGKKRIR